MAKGQRWIKSAILKSWKVGDGPAPDWVKKKMDFIGGAWCGTYRGKPMKAKVGQTLCFRNKGHVEVLKEAA